MSSSHSSPPEAQSLLSLVAGLRLDLLLLDCGGDRPSPLPFAANPPPTAAGRHALARSERCARRQNMLVHDADIPRPYSSQRRPRSALQTQTLAGASNVARSWKMAPRRYARRGQAQRVHATGFDPPSAFPTGICEIGSCPLTEFRKLSRLPDSERPAQRT